MIWTFLKRASEGWSMESCTPVATTASELKELPGNPPHTTLVQQGTALPSAQKVNYITLTLWLKPRQQSKEKRSPTLQHCSTPSIQLLTPRDSVIAGISFAGQNRCRSLKISNRVGLYGKLKWQLEFNVYGNTQIVLLHRKGGLFGVQSSSGSKLIIGLFN